ncbi:MAG: glycosyltransferase family 4 protein [Flavobacteriales bacterium]|nr:glycosyltransferase family 4 protein [Flavobacteriales bacterium]
MKVLWLSPTLNHYKAKFLSKLQKDYPLDITVLAGTGREGQGDPDRNDEATFNLIQLPVKKKDFGFSANVRAELKKAIGNYDWIMIPKENKNLLLFVSALWFRFVAGSRGKKTRFFSYNHPLTLDGPRKTGLLNRLITQFYYNRLDRVIFYTEKGCQRMIDGGFISKGKAFWANNTIDTDEIDRNYTFCLPEQAQPTILFIGRLVERKRLPILLEYFNELKKRVELKNLKLIVIGDGPQSHIVEEASKNDSNIEWKGAITDESLIAPLMSRASIVFIPGHSGLSVNHALCYGRPFVTFGNIHQPPEIDYVRDGEIGLILKGNSQENIDRIARLLVNFDPELYNRCYAAGKALSVDSWCQRVYKALQ